MNEIDFDIDESYSASDGYQHLIVLDPRSTPPVVTVRTQHSGNTTIDVWRRHVIPLGYIPNNCADTAAVIAVLTRREPDLRRLAAAHETYLDQQTNLAGRYAGTKEEIDWLVERQQEIIDEIDEVGQAAPTYWDPAQYFARSDWSEIDTRAGTLGLDRLTDRIVTEARADDVYLIPSGVTDYLRERLAREVEQAHEAAREEVCAYADCYSRATTTDGDGDPCCEAHAQED